MLATFLLILPFAAASALSPVMLTEQTLLLSKGRRPARQYAAGVLLTGFVFVALATLFGRALSLPTEPTLSASLDLALGVLLLLLAGLVIWLTRKPHRRSARRKSRKKRSATTEGAFVFGVVSMATNLTTLALLLPAAKIIADSGIGELERLPLEVMLALIAATPAWLPLALTRVAPGPAKRALNWTEQTIDQHGRELVAVALTVLGIFLILRGSLGL